MPNFQRCLLSLLLLFPLQPCLAGAPLLGGVWSLVEKESDDPQEALKGLGIVHRTQRYTTDAPTPGSRDASQERYFVQQEMLNAKKLAGATADVGLINHMLAARKLVISDQGNTVDLSFDDALRRSLKPGDGGPVYSAKGAEYSVDPMGMTLSWRRDGILQIETILEPRGKMVESYKLDPATRHLVVDTTIENPDWIIPAKIRRVFELAAGR